MADKNYIYSQNPRRIGNFRIFSKSTPQQAEAVFNKVSGSRNKKYPGLISMLQGFQKCIAWNPSKSGMEGPCYLAQPILPNFGELARIGRAT